MTFQKSRSKKEKIEKVKGTSIMVGVMLYVTTEHPPKPNNRAAPERFDMVGRVAKVACVR